MSAHSAFQEKMDVLDIIITILRDHEEALSRLADRLEATSTDISAFGEKISTLEGLQECSDGSKVERLFKAVGQKRPLVAIKCKDWLAFRGASHGALLVAFEATEDDFIFSSVSDLFVFTYSERSPEVSRLIRRRPRRLTEDRREPEKIDSVPSGELSSQDWFPNSETILCPTMVKKWLSAELEVPEERVVEARVLH